MFLLLRKKEQKNEVGFSFLEIGVWGVVKHPEMWDKMEQNSFKRHS